MDKTVIWHPSDEVVRHSNLYALMQERNLKSFEKVHQWSVTNYEEFWKYTIEKLGIKFHKPYAQISDKGDVRRMQWLIGAELNIAESCFKGPRDQIAVITRRQDGRTENYTIDQLDRLSNRVANSLKKMGFGKSDAFALDMMMSVEAIAIYLGIVKMGGAVISIPDSMPPEQIALRLKLGKAKAIFTQDVMLRAGKALPMYEKIREANPPCVIVLSYQKESTTKLVEGDIWWKDFLSSDESFTPIPCAPHDMMNILFSSGTTGEPKAIPWDHSTPIKSASDGMYHQDVKKGDVFCWPTNLGWMMGPWLIFATLVNGATVALYEGTPVERGFCEFVQDAKVTILGLVPSIVKGWRQSNCAEGLDWSALRAFSSSGEASNANDYSWLMQLNQKPGIVKPVIEYCGGTETGGAYIANNFVVPQSAGEFHGKIMGIDFAILNNEGKVCGAGESGEVFLIPPSIGLSIKLLNRDNDEVYYKDVPTLNGKVLRKHGDRIEVMGPYHFRSEGRADNTMNLGGIKVGSTEIERLAEFVPGIAEMAAIGSPPKGGGADRLVVYVVADKQKPAIVEDLKKNLQQEIKKRLNPLFHLHDLQFIDALPRTESNKIMHRKLRDFYRASEK